MNWDFRSTYANLVKGLSYSSLSLSLSLPLSHAHCIATISMNKYYALLFSEGKYAIILICM